MIPYDETNVFARFVYRAVCLLSCQSVCLFIITRWTTWWMPSPFTSSAGCGECWPPRSSQPRTTVSTCEGSLTKALYFRAIPPPNSGTRYRLDKYFLFPHPRAAFAFTWYVNEQTRPLTTLTTREVSALIPPHPAPLAHFHPHTRAQPQPNPPPPSHLTQRCGLTSLLHLDGLDGQPSKTPHTTNSMISPKTP